MTFTPSQVAVLPSWDTSGMRGTGSHDFEVRDVLVPDQRTFSVFTDAPREAGVLYRLPFGALTELPITAVAVGIARHALDVFALLAKQKKPHGSDMRRVTHVGALSRPHCIPSLNIAGMSYSVAVRQARMNWRRSQRAAPCAYRSLKWRWEISRGLRA
jgi:alkylation response protein AidB-like acyl-CoA dehydrogenase